MAIEATTKEELAAVKELIRIARVWALKHFRNVEALDNRLVDENLNMLLPSFFVLFPTPDTMKVTPSIMGKPAGLWVHYRLHFHRAGLKWIGKHPFYGYELPALHVDRTMISQIGTSGTDIPVPCEDDSEISKKDAIDLAAATILHSRRFS